MSIPDIPILYLEGILDVKMKKSLSFIILITWFLSLIVVTNVLEGSFKVEYPLLEDTISERYALQDLILILMGFRNLASDIALIELIQYTSSEYSERKDSGGTLYRLFKQHALRVIRIDPYNRPAYLFSAGILAWFKPINRPQEAIDILREGLRYDPTYWQYTLYIGAIAYTREGNIEKMINMMEIAITHPDCPAHVKQLVANVCKKHGYYDKAIAIWMNVLDSNSIDYWDRARREIQEIVNLELRNESS